ncbi:MAG: hypothetical protein R3B72_10170 [Polyangiaceae bacterium]
MRRLPIVAILALAGCPPSEPPAPTVEVGSAAPPTTEIAEPAPAAPTKTSAPLRLGDDEPLREGLVEMTGMVRPTKGGLDVRGVTFALETLTAALPPGSDEPGYDELIGAKLRVVAELHARHAASNDGDVAIQSRAGDWFEARRLVEASILAPAATLEGRVGRSKGFYAVGDRLVSREDLAWSLRGVDPVGKRVRLRGQPHTHVCPPQAQCLISGELPLFDVADAELVP